MSEIGTTVIDVEENNLVVVTPEELVMGKIPEGKFALDISDNDRVFEALIVAYKVVKKLDEENDQLRKRLYTANRLIDKLYSFAAYLEVSTRGHWSSLVRAFATRALDKLNKDVE